MGRIYDTKVNLGVCVNGLNLPPHGVLATYSALSSRNCGFIMAN